MANLNLYIYAGLALVAVWGVYRIAKLARSDERGKERDRAKADKRRLAKEVTERLNDGSDINERFGVRDD